MKSYILVIIFLLTACTNQQKYDYEKYMVEKNYNNFKKMSSSNSKEYLKFENEIKIEERKSNEIGMKKLIKKSNEYKFEEENKDLFK